MKNKGAWIVGVILIIIIFSLIVINNESGNGDTIKIGWSGALTGNLASLGENNMRGVKIAVDEINEAGGINGKEIEVLYQDDRFEGSETLDNYHKFKFEDIKVMLTTTYGGILTTSQLAENDQVVVINTVDTSEELAEAGDYSFAIGIYDEGIGYSIAEFLAEQGEDETVVIYNRDDPFVQLVKDAFKAKFGELGGKIILEEGYDSTTGDFRSYLTKIKNVEPNYLVVIGFEEQGLLLKQARDMEIKSKFVGIDTFSSRESIESSKGAIEGAYFTFWDKQSNELSEFISNYKNRYGEEPSQLLFAVTGYDSMKVLAEAMKNGNTEGEELKKSLYEIKDYSGLSGDLTMSSDGIVRSVREEIFQINGDSFVKVN